MPLPRPVIKRLVWPEKVSFFAIIGGGAGLFADVTSFFSEFVQPIYILGVFALLALLTALLCFQRAMLVDTQKADDVENVVHCRVCDAMRFSFFAVAAFLILMMIGQGQSATETLGEKLGLIHEDVKQVSAKLDEVGQDVKTIGSDVSDMNSAMQAARLILNPDSAEDYFTNAFIYQNMQRNAQMALDMLDRLYSDYNPQKMDAAELYYTVGRQILSKDELLLKMQNYAEKNKDATLLVIAGRNAPEPEQSDALYEKAREMDGTLPFAHWDIMRFSTTAGSAGISPAEQRTMLSGQIAGLKKFIEHIQNKPASTYFYLPQYQADHEMVARQTLGNLEASMRNYERLDEMKAKLPKRVQEQMP
jgi:tetratricopeptide (TPR) repeat protein